MEIHGYTKTTLLDYPGHVAATVFTAGCNFRCPFCHNGDLVLNPSIYPRIDESEIMNHLTKRKNVLSAVCISGGEATLQPDLIPFIEKIRSLGYLIKLDTNGYNPTVLSDLMKNNLLDYVAMDIKSGPSGYSKASGIEVDITKIQSSIDILKSSSVDYEFRTTCVKGIHTDADFLEIGDWLRGSHRYFLQDFKENESVIDKSCSSFSLEEMEHIRDIISPYIPEVELRGID